MCRTLPEFARLGVVAVSLLIFPVTACSGSPICWGCRAVDQSLSEEMRNNDVVVVATLKKRQPTVPLEPVGERHSATFEIERVIKGETLVRGKQVVVTDCNSNAGAGERSLLMATHDDELLWHSAWPISPAAEQYVAKVAALRGDEKETYLFFQSYLEHPDYLIVRDAYDELARFPHATLQAMRDQMPHDALVTWIKNQETPSSRRRLYLQMLGVCGNDKDAAMLAEEISSTSTKRRGLDAVIACYLSLRGNEGLQLVERWILKNKKADYTDTYCAIIALRFHSTQEQILDRAHLLRGFRLMLDRPDLADLVIPDLARLEDWESADRLAEMFKTADTKTTWLRVPVINYLRACPFPKADKLLKECEELDSQASQKARKEQPVVAKRPLRVALAR